jgi:mannose-1-phosphate guanylyltransferase
VTEIVLSMGYLPDRFVAGYPDFTVAGLPVSYAVEPSPRDTAGGIRFAALHAGVTDTFVVVNGDVMTDLDLTSILATHRRLGAAATIALHPVDDPSRFGVVSTDDNGWVEAFIEKPAPGTATANLINAGIYVMEPSVLDLIEDGVPVNVERATFPALVAARRLAAVADEHYWIDTGTPATYLQANFDVLTGLRTVDVDGEIRNESWVHPTSHVDPSAKVTIAAVGARCTVGAGAVIERSVVLAGATVASGAVVTDSVVGPRSSVGQNAHVTEGTVIGADQSISHDTELMGARVGGPA